MRHQIERLSPHQNGKVFALLFGVVSLVLVFPLFFIFSPNFITGHSRGSWPFSLFLMPVGYALIGYVSVAVGCALYNVLFKYIGGIEFDEGE